MEISLEILYVENGAKKVNSELDSRDTVPFRMVGLYRDVTLLR